MTYILMLICLLTCGLVIFFGKKILSKQEKNYENSIGITTEMAQLQIEHIESQMSILKAGQISILEEIQLLYNVANSHTQADIYMAELRDENQKLKKILKRKQNVRP